VSVTYLFHLLNFSFIASQLFVTVHHCICHRRC